MILAERAARMAAEAKAAEASAVRQGLTLEIERLKLEIARLRRERFGPSAERSARLEQLELSLEDLEEAAAEAEAAQAPDAGETTEVGGVYPPQAGPASAWLFVIDNPLQTELLIAKLKAAVPLSATVSPPLLALLQSNHRTSLCRPDARSPGSTMQATKAGSSANSISDIRMIGRRFSCRSRT